MPGGEQRLTARVTVPGTGERGVVSRGLVRVGPFMHWPQVLDEVCVDTDGVLARSGLSRPVFADPENVIPLATVGRLFDEGMRATGQESLGLAIGARSRLSSLGAVGLMMQASPTVGHALQVLARHYPAHDGGAIIAMDVDDRVAALTYKIVVPGVSALDQIYMMVLAMGTNYMRTMLGPAWRAREVLLPFARPADVAPLRKAFDAPLRFDADAAGLVFPATELAAPLATTDTFLYTMMLERLQQIEALAAAGLPDRVRHLLAWLIYIEGWNAGMLATRLGISLRTLNRRLADAGTTLKALREEAYRDAACQLLASTNKPTGEIAAILQYSDQSAFTRAFRRWQGVAPTQWRTLRRAASRPVAA